MQVKIKNATILVDKEDVKKVDSKCYVSMDGYILTPDNKILARQLIQVDKLSRVRYKDGNKLNLQKDNLVLKKCVNSIGGCKQVLSKQDVDNILNSSLPIKRLAYQYNVSLSTIYSVKKGLTVGREE